MLLCSETVSGQAQEGAPLLLLEAWTSDALLSCKDAVFGHVPTPALGWGLRVETGSFLFHPLCTQLVEEQSTAVFPKWEALTGQKPCPPKQRCMVAVCAVLTPGNDGAGGRVASVPHSHLLQKQKWRLPCCGCDSSGLGEEALLSPQRHLRLQASHSGQPHQHDASSLVCKYVTS